MLREYSAEISQTVETGGPVESKKCWHTWDTKSLRLLPRTSGITNQLPDVQEAGGPYALTEITEFIPLKKHMTQRSSEHGITEESLSSSTYECTV